MLRQSKALALLIATAFVVMTWNNVQSQSKYFKNWPARIDEQRRAPVQQWIQSACVLCSVGWAVDIGIANGSGHEGNTPRERRSSMMRANSVAENAAQVVGDEQLGQESEGEELG